MGLSESDARNPFRTVGMLCVLRDEGRLSDKEIAKKLGFNSVEDMRTQLQNWNVPDWLLGGTSTRQPRTGERQRKARRGDGSKTELPPAVDAVPLIREALESLLRDLEVLEHRQEYLKDERFVASEATTYRATHLKSDWTEDEWRELCEKLGQDPKQESFEVDAVKRFSVGAAQHPPGTLTRLIAAYALTDRPIESLLQKLHPDPGQVDREQLEKHIKGDKRQKGRSPGLLGEAEVVARLVRGGVLRRGPTTEELSAQDLDRAWLINMFAKNGASDEDIRLLPSDAQLTREEIARLRNLRLDP